MPVPDRSPAELRMVLVCGSVEPGRDGVGDYTRTLAAELVRRGVGVSAMFPIRSVLRPGSGVWVGSRLEGRDRAQCDVEDGSTSSTSTPPASLGCTKFTRLSDVPRFGWS